MIITIKAFLLCTLFILVVLCIVAMFGLEGSKLAQRCAEWLISGWVLFLAGLFAYKIWVF